MGAWMSAEEYREYYEFRRQNIKQVVDGLMKIHPENITPMMFIDLRKVIVNMCQKDIREIYERCELLDALERHERITND